MIWIDKNLTWVIAGFIIGLLLGVWFFYKLAIYPYSNNLLVMSSQQFINSNINK